MKPPANKAKDKFIPEAYINYCPCGAKPNKLHFVAGLSSKWGFVQPSCCGTWLVEFRTGYCAEGTPELERRMLDAWNRAPRE